MKHSSFSLLGNPNSGKTAVFNLLSGLNQKVSNYPGITVEKKVASISLDNTTTIHLEDYPGSYSLIPQSLDEQIVSDSLVSWIKNPSQRPDGLIYVADVTNLRRNLYFFSQLLIFDIPIILLLNMVDIASEDIIDIKKIQTQLGIERVIPFSAKISGIPLV